MKILVLNCGSSSIKYQLFDMPEGAVLAKGSVTRIGEAGTESLPDHQSAVASMLSALTDPESGPIASVDEIDACGHRVVHGADACTGSRLIDDGVIELIDSFSDLAPLHNPPNVIGIREMRHALGAVPQVACFDTAFHQTIPEYAYRYALPESFFSDHKIRRYGFHGTSHGYVAERARQMLQLSVEESDFITCHLGSGCSITAIKAGCSVDTSMGFTPLEGVMMGTRSGSFDPAILLYLMGKGYTAEALDAAVNRESGLLAISGVSNDERDVEVAAAAGDERAELALEMFAYQIRKTIGAYLAVLGGCKAVVFTGGIGERGPEMRARILAGMAPLGFGLDEARNAATRGGEVEVSVAQSPIKILVVATDEELAIAQETYAECLSR